MTKNFYITTPLYYPSSKLHLGHSYSSVIADVINRYKKSLGYNTFFLVGTDEHGQKIAKKAAELNLKPIDFVNLNVLKIKNLWKILEIDYDVFKRTTNKDHKELCQKIFDILLKKDLLYKGLYQGIYCKSCEEFLTSFQVNNNNNKIFCNVCKNEVDICKEETYFFKVSKFKLFLIKMFKENQINLFPKERINEMVNNFVLNSLQDLSITRTSFNWGINIKNDKNHILYVWFDALIGYLSGIKYLKDDLFFNKYWSFNSEIIQIIGKEITRFHAIYWPVLLNSLNLKLPDHIISHGWITHKDLKMSKSLGNVIDPLKIIEIYGVDALRFFIIVGLNLDSDNKYSEINFKDFYNANLVNNYGNLVSRVTKMIRKYFSSKIKNFDLSFSKNSLLINDSLALIIEFKNLMANLYIQKAYKKLFLLFSKANKYIEVIKPWTIKDKQKLKEIMQELSYVILVGTFLLKPVLIKTCKKVFRQFLIEDDKLNWKILSNLNWIRNININVSDILFKRM